MLPADHLNKFVNGVSRSRRLLARQQAFFHNGSLPKTELDAINELCFLNVFTLFESQTLEMLKTYMMISHTTDGRRMSLHVPESRPSAQRLLLGTNRYISIMPIEQLEKIARVYLREGRPFSELTPSDRNTLKKSYAIRNHIAHKSSDSLKSYKKTVLSGVSLPKKSNVPGYYLRSMQTLTKSYFDHHVSSLGNVMRLFAQA